MANFIKPDKFTDQTAIAADERRDHYDICNEQILEMEIVPDILFVGDSITCNWVVDLYLGKWGYLVNRGIGGDNTLYINKRADGDVFQLKPKRVVYMAGTNDLMAIHPDFWWNIAGMNTDEVIENTLLNIEEFAKRCKDTALYLCSVIPSKLPVPYDKDAYNKAIVKLNKGIEDICKKYGAIYVDYHSHMCSFDGLTVKDGLTHEGVHPNCKGYQVMADVLEKYLEI